ncbi:MAG: hypothetical protein ACPGSI_17315 [Pikeienuella sp.]
MPDSATASPTPGAWIAEPLTASEIDVHPDADRIWATIAAVREEITEGHEEDIEEARGEAVLEMKSAIKEAIADAVNAIEDIGAGL